MHVCWKRISLRGLGNNFGWPNGVRLFGIAVQIKIRAKGKIALTVSSPQASLILSTLHTIFPLLTKFDVGKKRSDSWFVYFVGWMCKKNHLVPTSPSSQNPCPNYFHLQYLASSDIHPICSSIKTVFNENFTISYKIEKKHALTRKQTTVEDA